MDEAEKAEVRSTAKRAARQARHATRNGIAAVGVAAEAIGDDLVDEAKDTLEKAEGTAQDAARGLSRIRPQVVGFITSQTGQGLLAVSVAIAAGGFAVNRFRDAKSAAKHVVSSSVSE